MIALREAIATHPQPLLSALTQLSEVADALHLAQRNRALLPLERRLRIALSRAFRAQGSAFVRRLLTVRYLYEAASEDDWGPLFEGAVQETREQFRQPLLDVATEALLLGGSHAVASLVPSVTPSGGRLPPSRGLPALALPEPAGSVSISFNLHNPRVSQYLHEVGGERIAGINQTTRDELRKILEQAASEGWSYKRTGRAISAKYAQFAGPPLRGGQPHIRSRAEMIAITESTHAYEHAKEIVAEDLANRGHPVEKRWHTTAKPCPTCAPNPGAGWIGLAKTFPSGHGRPPAHPGCRCASTQRIAPMKGSV